MAQIILEIGGRRYDLTVRPGQEEHFRRLGTIVDQRARSVVIGMTGVNEARQLLMTALLLADEIGGHAAAPASVEPVLPPAEILPEITKAIDTLADRIERIAARLERPDPAD